MTNQYKWVDNPTESGVAKCDTDVLNECLMHLKYSQSGGGGGGYIGQLSYGIRTDVPEGQLRCDGTTYPKELLPVFFDEYLVTGKMPTCTIAEYEAYLNTDSGNCGFIGLDTVSHTFRMPTIKDEMFIAQALKTGNIAKYINAGLPNITGTYTIKNGGGNVVASRFDTEFTGAFKSANVGTYTVGGVAGSYANSVNVGFDASKSSSIYSNSDTVTPVHIQYPLFMTVSNAAVPASEVQYNEFVSALESKANASDVDGQWTSKELVLEAGVNAGTSLVFYDLSAYLPDATNKYEILCTVDVSTGTTSGSASLVILYNDLSQIMSKTRSITRTASSNIVWSTVAVPTTRKIGISNDSTYGNTGTRGLTLLAYRRTH